jgi:cytosine/adenosine deaminase-related metal-dependent hydrolase
VKAYRFKALLLNQHWIVNPIIMVDDEGKIAGIEESGIEEFTDIDGYAIPGFQNAHSHAFQYAMAGMAERHSMREKADDFWSWREAMYQLALTISPDDLYHIARMLYAEMLLNGLLVMERGYVSIGTHHFA